MLGWFVTLPVTAATKVAALKGKQEEEPGNREGEKQSAVQAGKLQGTNGLAICCLTPKYQSLGGVYIKPACICCTNGLRANSGGESSMSIFIERNWISSEGRNALARLLSSQPTLSDSPHHHLQNNSANNTESCQSEPVSLHLPVKTTVLSLHLTGLEHRTSASIWLFRFSCFLIWKSKPELNESAVQ